MADIVTIKAQLLQLNGGDFQAMCDEYLQKEGYRKPVCYGEKAGTYKTTRGTPDSYFITADNRYVFAEYTTQCSNIGDKLFSDIKKCLDESRTGVPVHKIAEIVFCHTCDNLPPKYDYEAKEYCQSKGVNLVIIGIDEIASKLSRKYPLLAKHYLGIEVDTGQIRSLDEFIEQYDSNPLAAPLNTCFQFREKELQRIYDAFDKCNIVILSGAPGVGKTKLAVHFADQYAGENNRNLYCFQNQALELYEDLRSYMEQPGAYLLFIDDANQLSQLSLIIDYVNRQSSGYDVKILLTVRKYAFEKVKNVIQRISAFEVIEIGLFTDQEIESLIVAAYGKNISQTCLDRIARIAEGNARLAMLAGKVAKSTNRLASINDASQLYDAYYGEAFTTAGISSSRDLQISAGIIAFLGAIRLDRLGPVQTVLNDTGITLESFDHCVHQLHDKELADLCHDKAVAISDQCFANYILKYVIYDKKTLRLSRMLELCFLSFRQRTIHALNVLGTVFGCPEMHNFISDEVGVVWEKYSHESTASFWELVKAFYPINQEQTLIFLQKQIEETQAVIVANNDICGVNEGYHPKDNIIEVLGGFFELENIDAALDLFFEYYKKRPDLYKQFLDAATFNYGINRKNLEHDLSSVQRFISKITEASNHWENVSVRRLFFDYSKELLQFSFSPHEATRNANGVRIYTFFLVPTAAVLHYRKTLWEQLTLALNKTQEKRVIFQLLESYGRNYGESGAQIIHEEVPLISQIIHDFLQPSNIVDCFLVRKLHSIFQAAGSNDADLLTFLSSAKLAQYDLLNGPEYDFDDNYNEYQKQKKEAIQSFLQNHGKRSQLFDELFDILYTCITEKAFTDYSLYEGFNYVLQLMLDDKSNCIHAAQAVIDSGIVEYLDIVSLMGGLLHYLPNYDILQIIETAPEHIRDYWLFVYYQALPEDRIFDNELRGLYQYLQCDLDRTITRAGYRNLGFLQKYEKLDNSVFIKALRMIYQKRSYSPFIVKIYCSLLFFENITSPDDLLQHCSEDISLLKEIYCFMDDIEPNFDYHGVFFTAIFNKCPGFIDEFCSSVRANSNHQFNKWDSRRTKLQTLFSNENYLAIIDSIVVKELEYDPFGPETERLIKLFIHVPNQYGEKSKNWIRHYISSYNTDKRKMEALFSVIAELPPEIKREYIADLTTENADPDVFEQLPLLPSFCEWTDSIVPVLAKRIDYLQSLLPHFTGAKYLHHRLRITRLIQSIGEQQRETEINEIVNG